MSPCKLALAPLNRDLQEVELLDGLELRNGLSVGVVPIERGPGLVMGRTGHGQEAQGRERGQRGHFSIESSGAVIEEVSRSQVLSESWQRQKNQSTTLKSHEILNNDLLLRDRLLDGNG